MIVEYVVYMSSGVICRSGSCPESMVSIQAGRGELVVVGIGSDKTQWVDQIDYPGLGTIPVVVDKEETPVTIDRLTLAADSIDTVTISGLPSGTTVRVERATYEVGDGMLELAFDTPGTYEITCECFPYLPAIFTVEAL